MMFTPIAISLAFGVLTSSLIALLVVPCFCLILEDIKLWLSEGKTPSEQNL
jgi:multidrug efflux pump subunit AcrB